MAVPSGRYRFTGREFDSETGLQYHRDRYYDPATGRWLTEDRLRGEDSNPYRYVRNNPVNAVDPTGRKRRIVLRFSYQELQRRKLPAKEIDYLKRNNAKYARTIFEFFTAAGLKNGAYGQQELRFNPPLRSTGGGNLEVQAIYDLNTQKLVRAGFVLKYATKTADGKKRFVDYGFEFYDSVEELLRVYRLNIQVMQAAQGTVAFLAFSGVGFSVPIYEPLPRLRRPAPRPRPQRPQPPPNTQTRRLSSLEEGPVLDDFKPGDSGFSGVYDTATGKWHTQPSGTPQHPPKLANGEPVKPFVQRIGGHRDVQAELIAKGGVNGDKTVGFALVYNRDGSLTIRWNSGINQMNFQQRSVPPEFRPSSLLK